MGKIEVLGENPVKMSLGYEKSHVNRPGIENVPSRSEFGAHEAAVALET